ncbi:MAG: penicillin-binding protein activator LpoB [Desulfobacteraceae bacterium]|nr:MAG: penicillin-binding protein activator LpoB [Desulfobacteraceae bacterium]
MKILTPAILWILIFVLSCSYQQEYVQKDEIHTQARLAAVLPLVNLTSYPNAGRIVQDLLITELYANTHFQIMEQTEVLKRLKGKEPELEPVLENAVVAEVGRELGVDTVIFGSVTEFRYKRGLDENPVAGMNLRLLDVKTNRILWVGSKSASGGCFWFCEDSLNRLAQKICSDLVVSMVKDYARADK